MGQIDLFRNHLYKDQLQKNILKKQLLKKRKYECDSLILRHQITLGGLTYH